MPSGGISRLRSKLVTSTQYASNSDTEEENFNSSLSLASSHSSVESPRGCTRTRHPNSDRPARTPLQIKIPLPQKAEITKKPIARNDGIDSDRENKVVLVQVDEDWEMGSSSPIELTYAPIHFHQPYEDEDIVMASPANPSPSPTPEKVQSLGSSSDMELPHSPTLTEVLTQYSSTWETSSSWGTDPPHSPTSKEAQDSVSWGCSPWETDLPHTPKVTTQDSSTWGSSSWGTDTPCLSTPKPAQDSSTGESFLW